MIRKVVIPVAGKATRLMPVSSVVPKAMFPLVDEHNKIYSVVDAICWQAISAGIESIGIVISPWQTTMVQEYFRAVRNNNPRSPNFNIEYIVQYSPRGFGDAVMQAAEFIGDEAFMLFLGDHIYIEDLDNLPCPAQVVKAFDSVGGVAMVGMQPVSTTELSKVGVARGVQVQQDIYRCSAFVEKPDPETAQKQLMTEGLPYGSFLAHCGIYIFTPEIFSCLAKVNTMLQRSDKEVELAEAQSLLLEKNPDKYFLCKIKGRAYDIGTPEGYAVAQTAFRNNSKTF